MNEARLLKILKETIAQIESPHAELRSLFEKGAEIEYVDADGKWWSALYPDWDADTEYRIKPEPKYMKYIGDDAEPFIVEVESDCTGTVVWSEDSDRPVGNHSTTWTWSWGYCRESWEETDKLPDPFAKLKAALADGNIVEFQNFDDEWVTANIGLSWSWSHPVERYRIKPEPESVQLARKTLERPRIINLLTIRLAKAVIKEHEA